MESPSLAAGALRAQHGAGLCRPAVHPPQRSLSLLLLYHPLPLLRYKSCAILRLLCQPLLLLLPCLRLSPSSLSLLHYGLVILLTAAHVSQHLVRLLELLKLLIRAALIWVFVLGSLPVCLADRHRARAGGQPEHLIVTHARTDQGLRPQPPALLRETQRSRQCFKKITFRVLPYS
jgi:hypothetical protein